MKKKKIYIPLSKVSEYFDKLGRPQGKTELITSIVNEALLEGQDREDKEKETSL